MFNHRGTFTLNTTGFSPMATVFAHPATENHDAFPNLSVPNAATVQQTPTISLVQEDLPPVPQTRHVKPVPLHSILKVSPSAHTDSQPMLRMKIFRALRPVQHSRANSMETPSVTFRRETS